MALYSLTSKLQLIKIRKSNHLSSLFLLISINPSKKKPQGIVCIPVIYFHRCPSFPGLDPACTLKEDPNDPCCKVPVCTGTATQVPVPSYGPGISGYGTASYQPPTTVTGTTGPGISGSGTPSSFTGNGPSPTVSGSSSRWFK